MSMEVFPQSVCDVPEDDARQLDDSVEQMIAEFKNNETDLTKIVMECTSLATATKARANALLEQGFCGRLFGAITGKTRKMRDMNDRDLADAQYLAQKTLNRLAEQSALTMNMVVAVLSQVKLVAVPLNHLRNNVSDLWMLVGDFAKATADRLERVEGRLDMLEHENRLTSLVSTINVSEFGGVRYTRMDTIPKLACVINDFHVLTRGNWRAIEDWKQLRALLKALDLDYEEATVVPSDFIRVLSGDPSLLERFFKDTKVDLASLDSPVYSPPLYGLSKMLEYNNGERYVVDTMLGMISPVTKTPEDIALGLSCNYVTGLTDASLTTAISIDDFCRSLLMGLRLMTPKGEESCVQGTLPCLETVNCNEPNNSDLIEGLFYCFIDRIICPTHKIMKLPKIIPVFMVHPEKFTSAGFKSREVLAKYREAAATQAVPFIAGVLFRSFFVARLADPVAIAILVRFLEMRCDRLVSSGCSDDEEGDVSIPDITAVLFQLLDQTAEVSPALKRFLSQAQEFVKRNGSVIDLYLQYGGFALFNNLMTFDDSQESAEIATSVDLQSLMKEESFIGMLMRYFHTMDMEIMSREQCFLSVNDVMGDKSLDNERKAYFKQIWLNHVEGWEERVAAL